MVQSFILAMSLLRPVSLDRAFVSGTTVVVYGTHHYLQRERESHIMYCKTNKRTAPTNPHCSSMQCNVEPFFLRRGIYFLARLVGSDPPCVGLPSEMLGGTLKVLVVN